MTEMLYNPAMSTTLKIGLLADSIKVGGCTHVTGVAGIPQFDRRSPPSADSLMEFPPEKTIKLKATLEGDCFTKFMNGAKSHSEVRLTFLVAYQGSFLVMKKHQSVPVASRCYPSDGMGFLKALRKGPGCWRAPDAMLQPDGSNPLRTLFARPEFKATGQP